MVDPVSIVTAVRAERELTVCQADGRLNPAAVRWWHHFFNRYVICARGDQCFGNFDGEIVSDAGKTFLVRSVFGLAEEVHRKW